MNNEKLGQEPAFACTYEMKIMGENKLCYHDGISKRFYAACEYSYAAYKWGEMMSIPECKKILNLNENDNWIYPIHFPLLVIKLQYLLSDELLKQESL